MDTTTTRTENEPSRGEAQSASPEALALCVVWCPAEPGRLGEVAILPPPGPGSARLFGRGDRRADDPHPRLAFARHRPGLVEPSPPFGSENLSRAQLVLTPTPDGGVHVRNVGHCPLLRQGEPIGEAVVAAGDTLRLGRQVVFLVVRRPAWLPQGRELARGFAFGAADAHGLVGESAPAWALRQRLHFVGPRSGHALVLGESGTGKELAARALHALSPRAGRKLVARNAATIPEALADAELFGNVRNYPNVGMPERPGLFGEANGATLFLDEFAELPPALHAHFLRVLDAGEYQRLGEARALRADVRLVAATNRHPSAIKPDLLARFSFHVEVPDLNCRREDIPAIVRHLLRAIATADEASIAPFRGPDGEARVSAGFLEALVRRTYSLHARELHALLWRSLGESSGDTLTTPAGVDRAEARGPDHPVTREGGPTPQAIRSALDRHDGVLEKAWRELGLSSRHALARLMSKHGLTAHRRGR